MELPPRYVYTPLSGKKIVFGVTGSSAIYRAIDLARELIRRGAKINVVMTPKATELVSPELFQWATSSEVVYEITGRVEHVDFSLHTDAMVIAPATLTTLSKIAYGIGDNAVTLTAITMLGSGKPVIAAPAMNINIYSSPQYTRVSDRLEEIGIYVVKPFISEGKAKFPPIRDLAHIIDAIIHRGRDLKGLKALVTAGPTREYIDPVRIISNPSSGLMGVLLALELCARGAEVDLVHGPLKIEPPYLTRNIPVETTTDMARAVEKLAKEKEYDIAVFAGAPADYMPREASREKIPSRRGELSITLVPTPKVIKSIRRRPRLLIGFAAETTEDQEKLVKRAKEKLIDYNADLIVANTVGFGRGGFEKMYSNTCLIWRDKYECLGLQHKAVVARKIIDWVAETVAH